MPNDDELRAKEAERPKDEPRVTLSGLNSLGAMAALMSLGGMQGGGVHLIRAPETHDHTPYRSSNNAPRVNKYTPHVGEKQRRKALAALARASVKDPDNG